MKALGITRHCQDCSEIFGCKDENEIRVCKECINDPDYCSSNWQDVTTGICDDCYGKPKGGA